VLHLGIRDANYERELCKNDLEVEFGWGKGWKEGNYRSIKGRFKTFYFSIIIIIIIFHYYLKKKKVGTTVEKEVKSRTLAKFRFRIRTILGLFWQTAQVPLVLNISNPIFSPISTRSSPLRFCKYYGQLLLALLKSSPEKVLIVSYSITSLTFFKSPAEASQIKW
jgi:hypothetical protein